MYTVHTDDKIYTYVAKGARISSDNREYIKHDTPIDRFPSKPKKLIILSKLSGSNDALN